MKELFTGIYSKFTGTTGGVHNSLYTALSGRMYNTIAPQDSALPYAVFQLVSDVPDWTFNTDWEECLIQFNIFDGNSSASNICDAYGYLTALYDHCNLTVNGWTPVLMYRELSQLLRDEEEECWQYLVQYRLRMEKSR